MTNDRLLLVATACGILALLAASILFPVVRGVLFWVVW